MATSKIVKPVVYDEDNDKHRPAMQGTDPDFDPVIEKIPAINVPIDNSTITVNDAGELQSAAPVGAPPYIIQFRCDTEMSFVMGNALSSFHGTFIIPYDALSIRAVASIGRFCSVQTAETPGYTLPVVLTGVDDIEAFMYDSRHAGYVALLTGAGAGLARGDEAIILPIWGVGMNIEAYRGKAFTPWVTINWREAGDQNDMLPVTMLEITRTGEAQPMVVPTGVICALDPS